MNKRKASPASLFKGFDRFENIPVRVFSKSRHHERDLRCDLYAKMWRDGSLDIGPICYPSGSRMEIPEYMIADEDALRNLVLSMYKQTSDSRNRRHTFYVNQYEGKGWW